MELRDKVAVVTGGASGIGRAVCRRFAASGAKVVVTDVNEAPARAVASEIGGLAVRCDVAQEDDVRRLVREAEAAFGSIDLFYSNAGIATGRAASPVGAATRARAKARRDKVCMSSSIGGPDLLVAVRILRPLPLDAEDGSCAEGNYALPWQVIISPCGTIMDRLRLMEVFVAIADSGAEITHPPLPTIHGDSIQLERLFTRLLENAIKYRSEAPPRITIAAVGQGRSWLFSVTDNGIGIDPRFRDRPGAAACRRSLPHGNPRPAEARNPGDRPGPA